MCDFNFRLSNRLIEMNNYYYSLAVDLFWIDDFLPAIVENDIIGNLTYIIW